MPEISGIIQNYLEGSIKSIGKTPVIESKSITENGTYTAPSGVDGYSPITVNVPVPTPVIESKSITENGTYTAPSGVDGYSPITVNVPSVAKKIFNKNMASFNEASMAFEFGLDLFNVIWRGSSSIGAQVYGLINLRGYNKITVKGHATTSWYWTYNQQDTFKLTLGLSSVMATAPSQISSIDSVQSAPLNENFTMEINISADTDCYMYFSTPGFNLDNVQIEVI